jgi:hypothetical protein
MAKPFKNLQRKMPTAARKRAKDRARLLVKALPRKDRGSQKIGGP